MVITCIDGREGGGKHLKFTKDTVRVTEIAVAIPPYQSAPSSMKAKFGFLSLKGISQIFLKGHSFCGGAQVCMQYPTPEEAPEDAKDIVRLVSETGIDLPRLNKAFMAAAEGDSVHASNMLARHLVVASLQNIMTYPAIDQKIREGVLDVVPLYHRLQQGTNRQSELERFDVAVGRWVSTKDSSLPHMCARPNNCQACTTCHSTIEGALTWVPTKVMDAEGIVSSIEIPRHTRTHILSNRNKYQPRMAAHVNLLPDAERAFVF